jgi:hypothetical protein
MPIPVGQVSLTAGTPGIFNAPSMGIKGLILSNESPYTVTISLQGSSGGGILYPETVDFFPVTMGFNGNVGYTPVTNVTNPGAYTQTNLYFQAVGLNENFNSAIYPLALSRQAVSATASGKPLFSACFGSASSGDKVPELNIFNASTNTVIANFYSAQVLTNDSSNPVLDVQYKAGADLNFLSLVTIASHEGSPNAPTSAMNATYHEASSLTLGDTDIDTIQLPANVVYDDLAFPDSFLLYPGGNLLFSLTSGSSGHIVRFILKWSEDPQ